MQASHSDAGLPAESTQHPGQAELATNYITANTKRPRPKPAVFSIKTGKKTQVSAFAGVA